MKQLTIYLTCLLWVWSPLILSAPLSVFLSGGVSTEVVEPPVTPTGITFIGTTTGGFTSTTSPTIAYPETQVNDILIVVMAGDTQSNSSGAPPTGWTKLHQVEHGTTSSVHTFWKRATLSPVVSEIWTNLLSGATTGVFAAVSYRGCITTDSPIDVSSVGSQANSTSWSTGAITTLGPNRMAVGIFGGDFPSGLSFTWGVNINERVDFNNGGTGAITIGDILVPVAGEVTMTTTASTSTTGARLIYALKPLPAT